LSHSSIIFCLCCFLYPIDRTPGELSSFYKREADAWGFSYGTRYIRRTVRDARKAFSYRGTSLFHPLLFPNPVLPEPQQMQTDCCNNLVIIQNLFVSVKGMRQKNGRFSENQRMEKEKFFCDFFFFLLSFKHICQKH
jgi:hypothetical protein